MLMKSCLFDPRGGAVLKLLGRRHRQCDGVTRRDFLQIGSLGLGGLTMADLIRLKAQGAVDPRQSHKAAIMIFLSGGPSHLDTYDMKPNAPMEFRGEFRPTRTNVPGVEFCDLMPMQAQDCRQDRRAARRPHRRQPHRQRVLQRLCLRRGQGPEREQPAPPRRRLGRQPDAWQPQQHAGLRQPARQCHLGASLLPRRRPSPPSARIRRTATTRPWPTCPARSRSRWIGWASGNRCSSPSTACAATSTRPASWRTWTPTTPGPWRFSPRAGCVTRST